MMKNPLLNIQYIRSWLRDFDEVSDAKVFLKIFEKILTEVDR